MAIAKRTTIALTSADLEVVEALLADFRMTDSHGRRPATLSGLVRVALSQAYDALKRTTRCRFASSSQAMEPSRCPAGP